MKTNTIKLTISGFILFSHLISANAQNGCVQCTGSTASGNNASAIGNNNTASGNNSFAGGYNSQAMGSNSFAFGYNSKASKSTSIAFGNSAEASGTGCLAIGNYVKAWAQNTFIIGSGTTANYPLSTEIPGSIAFGMNSNTPTMLITKSLNNNFTGKVLIGQVLDPQAKLHIKADNNEDAALYLETTEKQSRKALIKLYDQSHTISVDKTSDMEFNSGNGNLNFIGNYYCFGNNNENKTRIYTKGIPALYHNSYRFGGSDIRDGEGSSYAILFNNDAMEFRTASYHNQTGGAPITNWHTPIYLTTDGKVGIGSTSTYLENNADKTLIVQSPNAMDFLSKNITLSGKIGINTINNVSDYALAVDGGVISTKVFIKEVNHWPDHVFDDNYQLLELNELKSYLNHNKHLPGIPSEQEVVENGYDINEMQYLMLEKIEEMTRYIILLQDEIDLLKSETMPQYDTVRFTYDANGNRVSRSLTFKRIVDPKLDPTAIGETPYDLFPNPTSDQFSIVLKEPSKGSVSHATLFNSLGALMDEKDIHSNITTFDLSGKANGIYILEIDGPEGRQSWKVLKQ